ncbi:hypothetical protein GJAV_G00263670 [Gymnothorax javanicus]|nr:hypothetical protein GJAV_G00263670 [Gymnothorax javanicus]
MKMRDQGNLKSNNSAGHDRIFYDPFMATFDSLGSTQGKFKKWQGYYLYSTIGTSTIADSRRRTEREHLRREFTFSCGGGAHVRDRPARTEKNVVTGRFQDVLGRNQTLNTNDSGWGLENAIHSGGRRSNPHRCGKSSDGEVQLVMDATFYQIAGDSLVSANGNVAGIKRRSHGIKKISPEITRSPGRSHQVWNGRRKFTFSICSWWALFFFHSLFMKALAQGGI